MAPPNYEFITVPGPKLPQQSFWPALHSLIITAYSFKDVDAFPASWSRLDADPAKAAQDLSNELGDNGFFTVIFDAKHEPIACGGCLPFRGENWIIHAFDKTDDELANGPGSSPTAPKWETCCWCVAPSARGQGLSRHILDHVVPILKAKGAEVFYTNYVQDETALFWPKLGFEVVPGAGGMLPKGFKTDPAKEGLKDDVQFGMGMKYL